MESKSAHTRTRAHIKHLARSQNGCRNCTGLPVRTQKNPRRLCEVFAARVWFPCSHLYRRDQCCPLPHNRRSYSTSDDAEQHFSQVLAVIDTRVRSNICLRTLPSIPALGASALQSPFALFPQTRAPALVFTHCNGTSYPSPLIFSHLSILSSHPLQIRIHPSICPKSTYIRR